MDGLTVKYNELTADEFTEIWQSVWGDAPDSRQTALAMEHTLFRVSVYDGDKPVAMARLLGDMGLNYYIKDVAVKPEYQKKGIGRLLIDELLKFIRQNGVSGTDILQSFALFPTRYLFMKSSALIITMQSG